MRIKTQIYPRQLKRFNLTWANFLEIFFGNFGET